MNPDLSFCGIASLDMRGALELVSDTFEEALDRTVVALIILARYKQKLPRANRDVDEMQLVDEILVGTPRIAEGKRQHLPFALGWSY